MRARNLKPGFFKNEVLAGLPPMVRLTFAGLPGLADRAGRLEDRPARIKGELFPYEDFDVDAALSALAEGQEPFITRYASNGHKYIQINNFGKHNTPHFREAPSTIPALVQPKARRRQASVQPESGPSVAVRNPESPFRNPESGIQCTEPTPKDLDAVKEFWATEHLAGDPEAFFYYHESGGWKVGGRGATKDWRSSARYWSRNEGKMGRRNSNADPVERVKAASNARYAEANKPDSP